MVSHYLLYGKCPQYDILTHNLPTPTNLTCIAHFVSILTPYSTKVMAKIADQQMYSLTKLERTGGLEDWGGWLAKLQQ